MINFLKNNLSFFLKKLKSQKKSYSYGGCDLLINYIFKSKNNGFYLDIGCQHPISNNNTYLLYKRGWNGINIDLDKKNIELFNFHRPTDKNICACVSSKEEMVDMYFFHDGSPINTIEKKTVLNKKNFTVKKMKSTYLNSLLKNIDINTIDYMNLDVEGHELDVLRGFDIKAYKPSVISVEYLDFKMKKLEFKNNILDNVLNSELYNYLKNSDYHFVNWTHADLIFVHNDFRD